MGFTDRTIKALTPKAQPYRVFEQASARKDGKRFAIALSGPLTADHPADPSIRGMREKTSDIQVIVINELLVRGNLPAATREVQQRLGS